MQPDLLTPALDYGVVDGVGRAWQKGIAPRLEGATFRAMSVGPLVEIVKLNAASGFAILEDGWIHSGSFAPLIASLSAQRSEWIASDGRQGLIMGECFQREDRISSFKIDAHKAAKNAGFGKAAALLVAALGEVVGNVADHSQALDSGLALFSAGRGQFEFVVADAGIGALNSLTQNPEYEHLTDDGEALKLLVEAGVSRHVSNSGHGNGFRPIFERLADMTGHLRFRSGDYGLTLDGRFGDRIGRQIGQRPKMPGFLVAISCQIPLGSFT